MAIEATKPPEVKAAVSSDLETASREKAVRRKIPGNFPYTSSPGVLRKVLEKIPVSEKPSVFTTDFLGTVMGATGGAARPIIPIMKAVGLLSQSGSPTELYSQFQTGGGRANAAAQALRNGFPEIFKRNTFAHKAEESAIVDLIVAVTGLPKSDAIVRYILLTFQALQDYAKNASEAKSAEADVRQEAPAANGAEVSKDKSQGINLVYNINVVLPETTNVEVFNAIFKSLKGNLLT
ncbi:DUF5343 domain-containing protein [Mesorhizobium sp. M0028]|uniref:DUF5343 domain-containing protein n=1 Tax=Mesorhizobium sp. M0028 TaxID=2956849 RepID=UPI003339AAED